MVCMYVCMYLSIYQTREVEVYSMLNVIIFFNPG